MNSSYQNLKAAQEKAADPIATPAQRRNRAAVGAAISHMHVEKALDPEEAANAALAWVERGLRQGLPAEALWPTYRQQQDMLATATD